MVELIGQGWLLQLFCYGGVRWRCVWYWGVVIIDTRWKAYIQVLETVGRSQSSRKAVGGSEVLAEDSRDGGELREF